MRVSKAFALLAVFLAASALAAPTVNEDETLDDDINDAMWQNDPETKVDTNKHSSSSSSPSYAGYTGTLFPASYGSGNVKGACEEYVSDTDEIASIPSSILKPYTADSRCGWFLNFRYKNTDYKYVVKDATQSDKIILVSKQVFRELTGSESGGLQGINWHITPN
ncbi:hypothetical protein IE81DRAFT_58731 [Ceraceosorus guamensis]|uniref:CUB domain-containing protein n=1 Tax=Ceraceosorus guamensis TaxID=1522189 RepID=A0A316W272_9BASI|nr:hypothetical protein IE81DRAFT_58731 [Ceraceosorus guamensis]PWN43779.1 hypothetical protein IE81DRAFT_58731 [Ceraceosorus guamensis]